MEDQGPPEGKIRMSLVGDFSALELDEIIGDLAKARASLEPAVPLEPPPPSSDAEVLVQENALFKFRTRIGGGLRIWLRSEGFGWVAFELTATDVSGIRALLEKEIAGPANAH